MKMNVNVGGQRTSTKPEASAFEIDASHILPHANRVGSYTIVRKNAHSNNSADHGKRVKTHNNNNRPQGRFLRPGYLVGHLPQRSRVHLCRPLSLFGPSCHGVALPALWKSKTLLDRQPTCRIIIRSRPRNPINSHGKPGVNGNYPGTAQPKPPLHPPHPI